MCLKFSDINYRITENIFDIEIPLQLLLVNIYTIYKTKVV